MLADLAHDHDLLWSGAITASLAFIGVIFTLIWGTKKLNANRDAAREIATQVLDYLDTGNGHTMGMAVARLEDQVTELVSRMDRTEVLDAEAHSRFDEIHEHIDATLHSVSDQVALLDEKLDNHLTDVQPLVEWTSEQMGGKDE